MNTILATRAAGIMRTGDGKNCHRNGLVFLEYNMQIIQGEYSNL
jgi:hypothetical protein